MTSLTKKSIDVVIFFFCALVGAIYFFYSIATQDILAILITLGIYSLGFLSRKLLFKVNSSMSFEAIFFLMSALISQAIVVIFDKGDRLDFLDNYIVVNTLFIVIITITAIVGFNLFKKFKKTFFRTMILLIYIATLLLLDPLGNFLMQNQPLAFFIVGSPLTYVALLNFGLLKSHFN